jgi:Flp pilus assembly protein TadD
LPPATHERLSQGIALQRRGDLAGALQLYTALLAENPNDAAALHYRGLVAYQMGDLRSANDFMSRSIAIDPANPSTWSDLGIVLAKQENYPHAVRSFRRALDLDERHPDALNNLGVVLKKLHRPREALPILQRLVLIRPQSVQALCDLAAVQYQVGDMEGTISTYQRAIKLAPDNATARTGLAEAYEAVGKFEQARMQYLTVLRRQPEHALALSKLLHLRDGALDPQWAEAATSLAARPALGADARIRLNVALGHYHDRSKNYDTAFHHLRLGCDEQFRKDPFDSQGYTRATDRLIRTFTPELFASAPSSGVTSERPLFIVGMPRSGTTLLEQILASHSQVAAGGELSMLLQVSYQTQELSQSHEPYPEGLRTVNGAGLARMAKRYLEHLNTISATAPRVTDKLPFNFMHVGVIALLFPNAKIIHCRRQPLDNCLSCYFTSFADRIQFANNLETLGRYYLDYHRLMEHWHRVLPGRILDVQYESLVDDTPGQIRKVLDFCALPWEDACLRFYETERGIRTPSRWQVRQPIYKKSKERWRNYEAQLQPLRELLMPLLESSGQ